MHIVSKQPNKTSPNRIEALAKLPVFFYLVDRPVFVVGGSDAACWKAEMLAAAGARVSVFAPAAELSDEMLKLAARGAASGSIWLHDKSWHDVDFSQAALVVGDLESENAAQFAAHVRASNVPVNVIDQPKYCDFQFGSVVNRSPVLIAISTDGASPILGQKIRQKIEAMLPATLAQWAEVAQNLRSGVMKRFAGGLARRAFWNWFADQALMPGSSHSVPDVDGRLLDSFEIRNEADLSVCYIVGTGSGKAENITLAGQRVLQSSDVIIFDEEIDADLLELARREATRLPVQSRGVAKLASDIGAQMERGRRVAYLVLGDGQSPQNLSLKARLGHKANIVAGLSLRTGLARQIVHPAGRARAQSDQPVSDAVGASRN